MEDNKTFMGTVVWFDPKAGYGFIEREGADDLFVHFSDIKSEGFKTLKRGQLVSFSVGENKRGQPKAIEVVSLAAAPPEDA